MRDVYVQKLRSCEDLILVDADELDVRSGSIATKTGCPPDVRFPTNSDRTADMAGGSKGANGGHASADLEQAINERTAMEFRSFDIPDLSADSLGLQRKSNAICSSRTCATTVSLKRIA
jgi:hypothetical protein